MSSKLTTNDFNTGSYPQLLELNWRDIHPAIRSGAGQRTNHAKRFFWATKCFFDLRSGSDKNVEKLEDRKHHACNGQSLEKRPSLDRLPIRSAIRWVRQTKSERTTTRDYAFD
ncbi:hypothetical protein [Yoonia sp. SS1-5]|uniref:Uncharacterized protein n=1 Tax=Yoonia rhodophyticola TaxID=3137370 RepID=A0AAN0MBK2_9RHOB